MELQEEYFFHQPACEFEQSHGVKGISMIWNLPDTDLKSRQDLERKLLFLHWEKPPGVLESLKEILQEVEPLNPALRQVSYDRDSVVQLMAVLQGMAAGFTPQDIDFYLRRSQAVAQGGIRHREYDMSTEAGRSRKLREEQICAKLGIESLGWIASPETLDAIWSQVRHRANAPRRSTEATFWLE